MSGFANNPWYQAAFAAERRNQMGQGLRLMLGMNGPDYHSDNQARLRGEQRQVGQGIARLAAEARLRARQDDRQDLRVSEKEADRDFRAEQAAQRFLDQVYLQGLRGEQGIDRIERTAELRPEKVAKPPSQGELDKREQANLRWTERAADQVLDEKGFPFLKPPTLSDKRRKVRDDASKRVQDAMERGRKAGLEREREDRQKEEAERREAHRRATQALNDSLRKFHREKDRVGAWAKVREEVDSDPLLPLAPGQRHSEAVRRYTERFFEAPPDAAIGPPPTMEPPAPQPLPDATGDPDMDAILEDLRRGADLPGGAGGAGGMGHGSAGSGGGGAAGGQGGSGGVDASMLDLGPPPRQPAPRSWRDPLVERPPALSIPPGFDESPRYSSDPLGGDYGEFLERYRRETAPTGYMHAGGGGQGGPGVVAPRGGQGGQGPLVLPIDEPAGQVVPTDPARLAAAMQANVPFAASQGQAVFGAPTREGPYVEMDGERVDQTAFTINRLMQETDEVERARRLKDLRDRADAYRAKGVDVEEVLAVFDTEAA